eukprot:scaffold11405_cov18-Tisochrysis_lutea.AAC.1
MLEWQQTHIPELVHDTGSVDVVLSACSTRHAALVSRAGELYTWGYGKGEGRRSPGIVSKGSSMISDSLSPLYARSATISVVRLRTDGKL